MLHELKYYSYTDKANSDELRAGRNFERLGRCISGTQLDCIGANNDQQSAFFSLRRDISCRN
jgi:hypothetical protein